MRKSYIWATAITLGLGLWMASPYLLGASSSEEGAAVETAAAEKLFKVRVKTFTAIPRVWLSSPPTASQQRQSVLMPALAPLAPSWNHWSRKVKA